MFEWKKLFEVDVCEKLHAFRSPFLELTTAGAGGLNEKHDKTNSFL